MQRVPFKISLPSSRRRPDDAAALLVSPRRREANLKGHSLHGHFARRRCNVFSIAVARTFCLRFRYFSLQRIYHRAILLQNLLLRVKKIVSENLAPPSLYSTIGHRFALVLFQVVLGMQLDQASIKNLLFRIFSILWRKK